MSEQLLTHEDRQSVVWRKIRAHCEVKLRSLRAELECDVTPERTANLRGQIRSHIILLALGDAPAPALEAEDDED